MTDTTARAGEDATVTASTLDERGDGVALVASAAGLLRMHVPGALPGEQVRVRLAYVSVHARDGQREAWADLLSVLAPSAERVTPPCAAQRACGGCALMCLAYPAQLAWKRERVVARLRRHEVPAGIPVAACVASPSALGYRSQAKYVYARLPESRRLALGAFVPRSHSLVDLAGCRVVEPVLDEVRRMLLDLLVSSKVEPFDERLRTGMLRYVVMRANVAGRVMVTLVAARRDFGAAREIATVLAAQCPQLASVVLNLNATTGNRIFGDAEQLLWGEPYLEDHAGGVKVRLASRAFFQVNRAVASRIYGDIAAAVPGHVARAVDAYAGSAPIALALAPMADEVVAIEESPAATATASAFIAQQGKAARLVRVMTGDAGRCLAALPSADVVVLDPPRKGCAGEVLAQVTRLRPRLLAYLSCEPDTLARDLAILVAAGGRVGRVTPYDMLPHTPHVETLALVGFEGEQPGVPGAAG